MVSAAEILLVATVGYIYTQNIPGLKFSLARKNGWHCYLYVLAVGLALYMPSLLMVGLKETDLGYRVFGTFVVAFICYTIWRLNVDFNTKSLMAWRECATDDLDVVLDQAMTFSKPIQVTLDNRKIYIGHVADTMEPDPERSYLTIIPLKAGYRDSTTLTLKITHSYENISNSWKNLHHLIQESLQAIAMGEKFQKDREIAEEELNIIRARLVLPRDRIVTCHIFNPDIHEEVQKQLESSTKT